MKILFVTLIPLESNESASIRNYNLIKGFVDLGHSVEVLTTCKEEKNIDELQIKVQYIYSQKIKSENDSLKKKRSKIKQNEQLLKWVRYIYHKLIIFDSTIRFVRNVDISMLDDNQYDVVVSSSDPVASHIAVSKLKKQGLRWENWIQYWGDPFVGDITKECIYPEWILKHVELKLQKGADKVVYVSPFTLERQKKLYPQMSDKYFFLPIPYSIEKKYCINTKETLNVGYLGAYHSKIRNIRPLYQTCTKLKEKIHLFLIGNSDIGLISTDNITVHNRITREELQKFEKECDAFVCLLNLKGTQLPGKIYHYAGTNKPILILIDGDEQERKKEYLYKFNRFIIAENNEESIYQAFEYLFANRETNPCLSLKPCIVAEEFLK